MTNWAFQSIAAKIEIAIYVEVFEVSTITVL